MQDLKTGLFLADNDQTRRVLPQTSADIVEMLSSAGEASNVQAEISNLRTAKLATPAVGGSAGQVLSLDESGNTVWKADEKGDTLPNISSATAGQVLKVNSAVNGTEWGDAPKELPEQLGSSGQVLAVNSAASGVEWKTPESGLPAIGTAGQVLAVNNDATGAEWKTPESGLPAIGSASAGDLLAVNSTADGVEFVKPGFYTKNFSMSAADGNLLVLDSSWRPAINVGSGISVSTSLYSGRVPFGSFGTEFSELATAGKIIGIINCERTRVIDYVVSAQVVQDLSERLKGGVYFLVHSVGSGTAPAHNQDSDVLTITALIKN